MGVDDQREKVYNYNTAVQYSTMVQVRANQCKYDFSVSEAVSYSAFLAVRVGIESLTRIGSCCASKISDKQSLPMRETPQKSAKNSHKIMEMSPVSKTFQPRSGDSP